jgi:hypothetical protein
MKQKFAIKKFAFCTCQSVNCSLKESYLTINGDFEYSIESAKLFDNYNDAQDWITSSAFLYTEAGTPTAYFQIDKLYIP